MFRSAVLARDLTSARFFGRLLGILLMTPNDELHHIFGGDDGIIPAFVIWDMKDREGTTYDIFRLWKILLFKMCE